MFEKLEIINNLKKENRLAKFEKESLINDSDKINKEYIALEKESKALELKHISE